MHTAPDLFMIVIPDKATPTASEAAVDTVSRWGAPVNRFNRAEGGFFWSTYKALCRRDGVYANAQGSHDWNAELIEPIMKAVAPGWEKIFSRRVHTIFSNAGSESANLLKKFHDTVYKKITQATGPLGSLHMLTQQLRIYQQSIKEIFNQQVLDMSMQSRDINRMFEPVVVEAMVPAYAICVEERGTTVIAIYVERLLTIHDRYWKLYAYESHHVFPCVQPPHFYV